MTRAERVRWHEGLTFNFLLLNLYMKLPVNTNSILSTSTFSKPLHVKDIIEQNVCLI